jgi:Predicted membrane protein
VLETTFASINAGKFINRGFLTGSFCPIYGLGAILIIKVSSDINIYIEHYYTQVIINVLFSIILVTVLEYITGFILERLFNCKWWDYSDNYANIKGYVCLKYSLLWGVLAFLLVQIVHPLISKIVLNVPLRIKIYYAVILVVYFIVDTIRSVTDALNLRKVIINYSNFSVKLYYKKIIQYKRFFIAFPRLLYLNAGVINRDIRRILNGKIDKIKIAVKNKFQV